MDERLPTGKVSDGRMGKLDAKQVRALRIVAESPAHELQDRPLVVLDSLVHIGLMERTKYRDYHNDRWWYCFETKLTAKGWEAVAKLPDLHKRRAKHYA